MPVRLLPLCFVLATGLLSTPALRAADATPAKASVSVTAKPSPFPIALASPRAITVDPGGNLYVADAEGGTVHRITPAGVVTTIALQVANNKDAKPAPALAGPRGLAVDQAGNIYVADTDNNLIRKITPAGVLTTLAGVPGSSGADDGPGATARFAAPRGLAVDAAGNVFVADSDNGSIRKITPDGTVTTMTAAPKP